MYKLIKILNPDNHHDMAEIEFRIEPGIELQEMLEYMSAFLKACGYRFEGELDIILPSKTDETSIS